MGKLLKFLDEKILFFGIAFLLLFIPLYPKFPLIAVSGTYVSIRLEDILVTILVFVFGLRLIIKRDFSILKWEITKLILLYFGVGLLSVVAGIFITKNIVPHIAFLHFLRRVEYISLFFVAYYSFKEIKQLKTFGWIILIATFGVIIYALGQKFFGWPVVSTMNKEFSKGLFLKLTWWARVNSTFAGHYDLAAYMVMITAVATSVFLLIKKWSVRLIVFILGLFCYYILILTASRISFAAFLIGVPIVLFFGNRKLWIVPFLVFSILGMIFSDDLGQRYAATFKIDLSFLSGAVKIGSNEIALAPTLTPTPTPTPTFLPGKGGIGRSRPGKGIIPTLTPTLTPTPTQVVASASAEYFEPTVLAVGRSTDIRLKVEWPRAITAFLKNPVLGTGYSSISLATDNDYLRILGETGLLGGIALLAVFLEILRKIYLFIKDKTVLRNQKLIIYGVIGAAIGYFINATFIDVFEASKVAFFFWIILGVGMKIIDLNNSNKKLTN